jgi:hypothetical protein
LTVGAEGVSSGGGAYGTSHCAPVVAVVRTGSPRSALNVAKTASTPSVHSAGSRTSALRGPPGCSASDDGSAGQERHTTFSGVMDLLPARPSPGTTTGLMRLAWVVPGRVLSGLTRKEPPLASASQATHRSPPFTTLGLISGMGNGSA